MSEQRDIAVLPAPVPTTAGTLTARRVDLPPPAFAPVRHLTQRTLPLLAYRLRRLGPTGWTGLLLIAAACGLVEAGWLPAQRAIGDLTAQLIRPAPVAPPAEKTAPTLGQIFASLPTRERMPAVLGMVAAQAEAAGVALEQGRYTYSPPTSARLARYTLDFPVKGEYARIRDFIDRSLQAVPELGLDKLRLERKSVGDMAISADVGFVVYLRGS